MVRRRGQTTSSERGQALVEFALALPVLLLLLFGGGGLLSSSLQILWIVLLIGLILWALGFVFRGSSGGRWYRW